LLKKFEEEGLKPRLDTYLVYVRLLLNKWKEVRKGKTTFEEDLKVLRVLREEKERNEKKLMSLEFNVNAKMVFFRNLVMVQRRILKELRKDFMSFNQKL